ncbi:hypothetical protein KBC04_04215 [Candidatus Babeliales bacterium]|nr:hypothetical protein [Candidatus Babeliales bacterium]MBP9844270.1 hypothetical protein [Candidatus Babeliales bacterium]
MMDIINIVFRFFDFFVVLGVGVYTVKHYLIPTVEKMMREYGVFIYNLESDCKNLQLQSQSIHENIQDQDQHFQVMQTKFLTWQKKCHELVVLQKSEQERIDGLMQQRFVIRSEYVKNDKALKEQLPAIVDTATKKLQQKFYGTEAQKQYIEELIQVMKVKS